MPSILIRDLSDEVKASLHRQARLNRRSMEEEARQILNGALLQSKQERSGNSIGRRIHNRFAALGKIDLPLPARKPMRALPIFGTGKRTTGR